MKPQVTLLVTAILLSASGFTIPTNAGTTVVGAMQLAQRQGLVPNTTYITPQRNTNEIAIDIRDGSFRFAETLRRTSGSNYSATNRRGVRVMYNRNTGRVTVINNSNGEELYNYIYGKPSTGSGNHRSSNVSSHPDAGTPVDRLSDLAGARAGQAENTVKQRGYRFVKGDSSSGNTVYTYWRESRTNFCVTIQTEEGRYQSFAYATPADCQR